MIYDYVCERCGGVVCETRSVADRDRSPVCCGAAMRRRIAAPRINTNRWCYDEVPHGLSERDRVEEAKQADKAYEASWGGHIPSSLKPAKTPSLAEVAKEFGW